MNPKVLVCVLHCDRKHHNRLVPVKSIAALDYDNFEVYYNIETKEPDDWKDLIAFSHPIMPKVHYDFWNYQSNWWKKPQFDQDQARLVPIVRGRNDSIECALDVGAEYILFVDSDMIIPANTITKLMSHNKPMVGGFVKGRNDHKSASYIFGNERGTKDLPNDLVECDHGNIGFVLIKKEVFEVLKFRRGRSQRKGHLQSDDPNYCEDAEILGYGRHVVDKSVKVEHIDETVIPFENGAQF
jgi:hypothetical protein